MGMVCMISVFVMYILMWMISTTSATEIFDDCTGDISSNVNTSSQFPEDVTNARLAYCRWRAWVLSRAASRYKIPPVPKMDPDLQSPKHMLDIIVDFIPITIFKVNLAEQTVHLTAGINFSWRDPALDIIAAGVVDNITDGNRSVLPAMLAVPPEALWMPSIVLTEEVDTLEILANVRHVTLKPDGRIITQLAEAFPFACKLDMTNYPYDEHFCSLTFIDSAYMCNLFPSTKVDITISDSFRVAGEWEFVDFQQKQLTFSDGVQIYTQFILHLKRKTTFYTVIVVLPLVMTSYLNVLVFLLPPDLGDKTSYLVTVTISLSVFSSFFNADMPRGLDSVPIIFSLYIFVLAEGFFTLLMSLFVIRKFKVEQSSQAELPDKGFVASVALDQAKNKVSPTQVSQQMESTKSFWFSYKTVDLVFFVVAFVSNTLGLAVILSGMIK